MKPKPLSALKNFTVPVVNVFSSQDRVHESDHPDSSAYPLSDRLRHRGDHSNAPLPRANRCQPSHAQTMTTSRRSRRDDVIRLISAGSVTHDGRRALTTDHPATAMARSAKPANVTKRVLIGGT